MKYAIYSRKSKYTGKGESIENQIELCRAYLFSHFEGVANGDILLYEDEGFSGKTLERPQFRKLLEDAKQKKFNYIVCYRLDRISRSVVDFSSLVELFAALEIGFICIREQFDTSTPMGRAMMYIASVFAQLERETIAERVRDNMTLLAREGRWLGGTPPLGFRAVQTETLLVDGKRKTACLLENDPAETETVQTIFTLFLGGYSLSDIQATLRRQEKRTRNGNDFSTAGLRQILSNPVYAAADFGSHQGLTAVGAAVCFTPDASGNTGLICYHKRTGVSGTERKCLYPDWIAAQGKHRPVISGKDWFRAQERLDQTPRTAPKKPHTQNALLAGLLTCGECGEKMYPKQRSSGKAGEFDYICRRKLSRKGDSPCHSQNMSGKQSDRFLRSHVTLSPLLPQVITELECLQESYLPEPPVNQDNSLARYNSELKRLIASAPVSGAEKAELLAKLQVHARKNEPKPSTQNEPVILNADNWFCRLPLADQREILRLFVARIVWKDGTLELTCRPGCRRFFR